MKNSNRLVAFGAALVLSGIVAVNLNIVGQVYAQETPVDVEKLMQVLNATRTAIEANDIPGALSQLDMADQVLSGGGNATTGANMTNSTS
jgi:hypothetical protein